MNFLRFTCLAWLFAANLLAQTAPAPAFTNSIGMKFVWIAPGTFIMGSQKEELARNDDEILRKVTLTKGFYMGIYTVTQDEWMKLMEKNPSKFTGAGNLPVEQVNWNDCQEFIAKLRAKDHKPYRLPTEAEWEYACRAGTTTPFWCGNTISTEQANYNGGYVYGDGKKGVYRGKTTPVGSFAPNPWGLYDMHGNVWQWCEDWFERRPKDGKMQEVTDPIGKIGGSHILRGGSWIDNPLECRSAYRGGSAPAMRHSLVGFRLCFSIQ